MHRRHRRVPLAASLALCLLAAGCEGGGGFLTRNTTVGALKTSVSQLEFQNERLEKELAQVKSENRRLDDQLVAEQAENDGLATRLDDAKKLLAKNNFDVRTSANTDADVDEPAAPRSRRRTPRKPPSASIPGRIEPARDADAPGLDDSGSLDDGKSTWVAARRRFDDRWLPVARGSFGADPSTFK